MGGSGGIGIGDDGPDGFEVRFLVFAQFGSGVGGENQSASLRFAVSKDDALLYKRRVAALTVN
jgi:hypothetical protein